MKQWDTPAFGQQRHQRGEVGSGLVGYKRVGKPREQPFLRVSAFLFTRDSDLKPPLTSCLSSGDLVAVALRAPAPETWREGTGVEG